MGPKQIQAHANTNIQTHARAPERTDASSLTQRGMITLAERARGYESARKKCQIKYREAFYVESSFPRRRVGPTQRSRGLFTKILRRRAQRPSPPATSRERIVGIVSNIGRYRTKLRRARESATKRRRRKRPLVYLIRAGRAKIGTEREQTKIERQA